jgi:hypothetical protein
MISLNRYMIIFGSMWELVSIVLRLYPSFETLGSSKFAMPQHLAKNRVDGARIKN